MISTKELLCGNIITDLSIAEQHNLEELKDKLNKLRIEWGKPMVVTSGFRTVYQHRLIYSKKGNDKPPMGSQHLQGKAADIADPYGALYLWCEQHMPLLADTGLWCEKGTVGWVHFQTTPPKSGARFFLP